MGIIGVAAKLPGFNQIFGALYDTISHNRYTRLLNVLGLVRFSQAGSEIASPASPAGLPSARAQPRCRRLPRGRSDEPTLNCCSAASPFMAGVLSPQTKQASSGDAGAGAGTACLWQAQQLSCEPALQAAELRLRALCSLHDAARVPMWTLLLPTQKSLREDWLETNAWPPAVLKASTTDEKSHDVAIVADMLHHISCCRASDQRGLSW